MMSVFFSSSHGADLIYTAFVIFDMGDCWLLHL